MKKMSPSLAEHLGRYEYRDDRSNKFWELSYNERTGAYEARWGRIGASPQITEYDAIIALKKVREKIAKGYMKTTRSYTAEEKKPVKAKKVKKDTEDAEDSEGSENSQTVDFLEALRRL